MAEIKRITIVTAQGVSDYTVGSKHQPGDDQPVVRIERTYGYADFYGICRRALFRIERKRKADCYNNGIVPNGS